MLDCQVDVLVIPVFQEQANIPVLRFETFEVQEQIFAVQLVLAVFKVRIRIFVFVKKNGRVAIFSYTCIQHLQRLKALGLLPQ